jgi:hypothetical protein
VKKNLLLALTMILNIAIVGAFIIWYCSRYYPMVGHDYRLFVPYMLDSYLHQKINGLTIQWYTPSFAGGRPVFPNPQDLQFSLPQFLLWVVNPWWAVLGSMLVYVAIGFIAAYYFLKRFLDLNPFASLLGALFFTANGFYFNHMAVGHITFQAFTLFPVIMIVIVHPKLPGWLAGLLLSFIAAILLYSGLHDITFFILTALIFLPLLYLLKPSLLNCKRLLSITIWGSILTLLVCGSKLWAVYSFMRFFPRLVQDNYTTTMWTGLVGIVHQLLGTMTLEPFYRLVRGKFTTDAIVDLARGTGTVYGYWELDASLSPALLGLLAGGAFTFLAHKPRIKALVDKKRLIAEICLLLAVWIVIEFTLAKGLIYPYLRNLPIIESERANVRNVCAFIFPLAVIGAVIFNNWTKNWKPKKVLAAFIFLNCIALGSLVSYHDVTNIYVDGEGKFEYMLCDIYPMLNTYNEIRYQGATFPVKNVLLDAYPWEVFDENAMSMIDPYNTFFGDITRHLLPVLHAGSVSDVTDGYYNIIDPTGYVFPEVNHSQEYERIPVTEKTQFLAFINRRAPDWKLPLIQEVLNWVALLTLLAEFYALLGLLAGKWIRLLGHSSKVLSERSSFRAYLRRMKSWGNIIKKTTHFLSRE